MQRYHRSTCCPASNIQPCLGCRSLAITRCSHLEASDLREKKARSCYHILSRRTVSVPRSEETLFRLHVSKADIPRRACLLELARIIELLVDTDDSADPSCKRVPNFILNYDTNLTDHDLLDGVVIFLILSVAEEVSAILCASLPVIIPQIFREMKGNRSLQKKEDSYTTNHGTVPQSRGMIRGFQKLGEGSGEQIYQTQNLAGEQYDFAGGSIPLNTVVAETTPQTEDPGDARVLVKTEYEVIRAGSDPHAV